MKTIVITNVYGYKNIGDGAILDNAIKIINKVITENIIHIHTATHFTINSQKKNKTKLFIHPYGIAIKTVKNPISDIKKIFRFTTVISISLFYIVLGKVFSNILPREGDYAYIRSLKEADIVLGIGGGYLRTKHKYKDYFGLLLTLLPIVITHLYNKRVLYLPMSYGNFASKTHAKIVFHIIKNDCIILRDEVSFREFSKNSKKKLDTYVIPDLVLFEEYKKNVNDKGNYVVLTARLWMNELKQKEYEKGLALIVDYMWERYKLKTLFIAMVWNKKEDDDRSVGKRIKTIVKNKLIFSISNATNSLEVKRLLSDATMAICTRMHSAIFSTIVRTPFITIAYEYKTVGFLKSIGLEKWNINIEDFSFCMGQKKIDSLMKNDYELFRMQLEKKHTQLRKNEENLIEIMKTFQQVS